MTRLLDLVRGFPGHPSHPPLTDVSIGAYTLGAALLVLAALGVDEPTLSRAGHLAISGGLIAAVPTALTGLLDWLQIPQRTTARTLATWHLAVMVAATVVFALAWLIERPAYGTGEVRTGAWLAALVAEGLLVVGGYIGGTVVYVTGHRVLNDAQKTPAEALKPDPGARPGGDEQRVTPAIND